jgi:hypothetical protein
MVGADMFPAEQMKGTNEVVKVRLSPRMNHSVNGMGERKNKRVRLNKQLVFSFLFAVHFLALLPDKTATTLLSNKHSTLTCFSYLRTPKSESTSKES